MKPVRFSYVRIPEKRRTITLAHQFSDDCRTAVVGWSVCRDCDTHKKKEGRIKAEARLQAEPITLTVSKESTTWFGRMADIYKHLMQLPTPTDSQKRLVKYMQYADDDRVRLSLEHIRRAYGATTPEGE